MRIFSASVNIVKFEYFVKVSLQNVVCKHCKQDYCNITSLIKWIPHNEVVCKTILIYACVYYYYLLSSQLLCWLWKSGYLLFLGYILNKEQRMPNIIPCLGSSWKCQSGIYRYLHGLLFAGKPQTGNNTNRNITQTVRSFSSQDHTLFKWMAIWVYWNWFWGQHGNYDRK